MHINDHLLDSKTKCIWLIMDTLASRTCQNTCLSFDFVTAHDNSFFTVSYFPSTALSDDKFPWLFTNMELWLVGRFMERFTEVYNFGVRRFINTGSICLLFCKKRYEKRSNDNFNKYILTDCYLNWYGRGTYIAMYFIYKS